MPALNSSIAFLYNNLASGKTVTATTEASGFPDTNLSTARLMAQRWHSTAGSLTSQNVDVDLGSALAFEAVTLLGTNLENAATRTVKTDNDVAFGSPDHDSTSGNVFDTTYTTLYSGRTSWPVYGRHLIYFPNATLTNRYVRLTLNNSGNADNYLRAGVYGVWRVWQPEIGMATWNITPEPDGEPGLERQRLKYRITFRSLTYAEMLQLRELAQVLKRTGRFVIVPRPLTAATWIFEARYVTFVDAAEIEPIDPEMQRWGFTIAVRDVLD